MQQMLRLAGSVCARHVLNDARFQTQEIVSGTLSGIGAVVLRAALVLMLLLLTLVAALALSYLRLADAGFTPMESLGMLLAALGMLLVGATVSTRQKIRQLQSFVQSASAPRTPIERLHRELNHATEKVGDAATAFLGGLFHSPSTKTQR